MKYRTDWFTYHIDNWNNELEKFKGKPDLLFLEIGSYEGRATRWLLDNILTHKTSKIVCIDPFDSTEEYRELNIDMTNISSSFIENVQKHLDRITIEMGLSQEILRNYGFVGKFDFAYVDGSHTSWSVLEDIMLTWRLIKKGGIMTCDDYNWRRKLPIIQKPHKAIDAFLECFEGQYNLIRQEYQVVVEKI